MAGVTVVLVAGVAMLGVWQAGEGGRGRDTATGGREYATTPGRRESVVLTDGTQFMLAPASRLRLGTNYDAGHRDVYLLEGEGYFAVAHDALHPFTVHVRNAVAEDIGTRFVVRSYPGEPAVQVAVTEGVVSLSDSTARGRWPALVLSRGAVGQVGHTGATAAIPGATVGHYVGWTTGELVFDSMPLGAVVAELSRWYGVNVQVAPGAVGDHVVSGVFPPEPLDVLLAKLAPVVSVRVERRGDTVVLLPLSERRPLVSGSAAHTPTR